MRQHDCYYSEFIERAGERELQVFIAAHILPSHQAIVQTSHRPVYPGKRRETLSISIATFR